MQGRQRLEGDDFMKAILFAAAAVTALALAACGGGEPAKPAEPAPAAEAPAPAPEPTAAAPTGPAAMPAATDVAAFMKARHENYEMLGANMKVLQDNFKSDTPDMAAATAAAVNVKAFADAMGDWFPAGTGPDSGIESEAKANIWTDRATFDAAHAKLQVEAGKLAAATDAAAFKAQFPATGGSCKNCHDTFREEKP
jgi:cytochrome c556